MYWKIEEQQITEKSKLSYWRFGLVAKFVMLMLACIFMASNYAQQSSTAIQMYIRNLLNQEMTDKIQ